MKSSADWVACLHYTGNDSDREFLANLIRAVQVDALKWSIDNTVLDVMKEIKKLEGEV